MKQLFKIYEAKCDNKEINLKAHTNFYWCNDCDVFFEKAQQHLHSDCEICEYDEEWTIDWRYNSVDDEIWQYRFNKALVKQYYEDNYLLEIELNETEDGEQWIDANLIKNNEYKYFSDWFDKNTENKIASYDFIKIDENGNYIFRKANYNYWEQHDKLLDNELVLSKELFKKEFNKTLDEDDSFEFWLVKDCQGETHYIDDESLIEKEFAGN